MQSGTSGLGKIGYVMGILLQVIVKKDTLLTNTIMYYTLDDMQLVDYNIHFATMESTLKLLHISNCNK